MNKSEIKRVWPESDADASSRRDIWRADRKKKESEGAPEVWVRRVARSLFGLKASDGGRPRRYPGYTHVMNRSLEVVRREYDVSLPSLPSAFDGYRILHLTDLHLDHLPRLAETLADTLQGIEVDLALVSGDFQENELADPHDIAGLVERGLAPLTVRDATFGILGNHDSWGLVEPLEAMGIRMLVNEVMEIRRGDERIMVAGTDDVHYFDPDGTEEALAGGPDGTRIALMHSPERADLACLRHQLLLCGHTHGGQVCLPGGRHMVHGLKRFRRYVRGLWEHEGMIGYTGAGVGTTVVPLRLNCPGEVVVFTLRR